MTNLKIVVISVLFFVVQLTVHGENSKYRSPLSLVKSADNNELFVAEVTAKSLAVLDLKTEQVLRRFKLDNEPMGLVLSKDGKSIYVTSGVSNGVVQQIDVLSGKILSEVAVGHSPIGPQISNDGKTLYV